MTPMTRNNNGPQAFECGVAHFYSTAKLPFLQNLL